VICILYLSFFFPELYAYWIHLLFNGTVWELVFNLVTKDNIFCVGEYEFEIWIKILTNNYEIWEIVSHLSNKKKLMRCGSLNFFFLVTPMTTFVHKFCSDFCSNATMCFLCLFDGCCSCDSSSIFWCLFILLLHSYLATVDLFCLVFEMHSYLCMQVLIFFWWFFLFDGYLRRWKLNF
jgi:hypothetical protein